VQGGKLPNPSSLKTSRLLPLFADDQDSIFAQNQIINQIWRLYLLERRPTSDIFLFFFWKVRRKASSMLIFAPFECLFVLFSSCFLVMCMATGIFLISLDLHVEIYDTSVFILWLCLTLLKISSLRFFTWGENDFWLILGNL